MTDQPHPITWFRPRPRPRPPQRPGGSTINAQPAAPQPHPYGGATNTEWAIDHLCRADVQNHLDPDTYRATTLILAMLNDAENQCDDLHAECDRRGQEIARLTAIITQYETGAQQIVDKLKQGVNR